MRDSKNMSDSVAWRRLTELRVCGPKVVQPAGSPEEWARTRMAILHALVHFPDAKAAVVAALRKLAAKEDP
jgi:hypothetical protein